MKHEDESKFEAWLDRGSWTAEAFKQAVCLSVFLGALHCTFEYGPGALDKIKNAPSDYSQYRARVAKASEKRDRDELNAKIIEAAHKEITDERVRVCKIRAKNRGQLLQCLTNEEF